MYDGSVRQETVAEVRPAAGGEAGIDCVNSASWSVTVSTIHCTGRCDDRPGRGCCDGREELALPRRATKQNSHIITVHCTAPDTKVIFTGESSVQQQRRGLALSLFVCVKTASGILMMDCGRNVE